MFLSLRDAKGRVSSEALRLHVETLGTGRPVMLLHSSGLSSRQFSRIAPKLVERGLSVVMPDLTGHGKSPPVTEMSWRDDVARVAELITEPMTLFGHSYGGLVALHVALALPDRVTKVIAYDPVAFGVLDRVVDADVFATLPALDSDVPLEQWLQAFVDYWSGAGAWDAQRESARAEFVRVGWVVREGVRSLMRDTTKASAYAAIPLSLITGELTPMAEQRVVERIGSPLTRIAGAGHMGPLTHGDAVLEIIAV
jgi:pimeloyl-ACP methyl ester carboxylesterase